MGRLKVFASPPDLSQQQSQPLTSTLSIGGAMSNSASTLSLRSAISVGPNVAGALAERSRIRHQSSVVVVTLTSREEFLVVTSESNFDFVCLLHVKAGPQEKYSAELKFVHRTKDNRKIDRNFVDEIIGVFCAHIWTDI